MRVVSHFLACWQTKTKQQNEYVNSPVSLTIFNLTVSFDVLNTVRQLLRHGCNGK